jgi:hypothetical protein
MSMHDVEVDILDMINHITISVRVRNLWRLRLGLWLVSLAARVLRVPVEVVGAEGPTTD